MTSKLDLSILQISDSHLFAEKDGLHFGASVYNNLVEVLEYSKQFSLDAIVFTGDLTQDHSEASYQRFVDAFQGADIRIPVYVLPGNHDDSHYLQTVLNDNPFVQANSLKTAYWQCAFTDSTSDTPAGYFDVAQLAEFDAERHIALFMHHHPVPVGYFIDRHGLKNSASFWPALTEHNNVKLVACGHVHKGLKFSKEDTGLCCNVYTCPATSIEFDKHPADLVAASIRPGLRIWQFYQDGSYTTQCHYLE
ncbi:metallophosphoesterase [Thalassotalea agarivorans]|uniref:Icc protein n=1 Tax=Thalassotalea agarivorans TaxID=349064 RepID=A0A1I0HST7_THASX|nr:metallophosphoesterase [Thalassotalea agarivorans]SET87110.1 Icc protein [Thalassotalea agarivorans]